jgi:hypothetical protein
MRQAGVAVDLHGFTAGTLRADKTCVNQTTAAAAQRAPRGAPTGAGIKTRMTGWDMLLAPSRIGGAEQPRTGAD